MHICFITHEYPKKNFPHGGIGTFIQTIGKAYVAKGCKVSVVGINVYTKVYEEEDDHGVHIYRLKPRKIKGLTWFLNYKHINQQLLKLHVESPIDVIETPELGLVFLKKIKPIKYIIRLHGGHHFFAEAEERDIDRWKGFQEKRSFKKADAFVAVSNYVKTHTSKYLSYNNKKISVIKSPIDLDVFKPIPEIKVSDDTILFAGTICEKKGIKQLILAMKTVNASYPNLKLDIYGRDWFFKDGTSYVEYLKEKIIPELKEFSKNIIFKGPVPYIELATKYAAARICVFPSLMETQGLVAPEAMAMKKVVVFSNLGPGPETIEHKKTGLLCNPYDVNNIAENILWALENPKKCLEIEGQANEFVYQAFNTGSIVNKNIDFYKSIL
ncbi:glycosyltransferase family 4 protein [Flavivirga algicola]|uniref:Glycosyltransferase family 4 protein n=1 Tax=Flavivirga algicola TaxID=2729136 RepID=A0ABX1RS08_9FLAO|nr:glycosyltransferase family 4 protein [Flavivirga algicola]NMH86341.1 glycosyltransferase family 4 protein [Flavivirga algicola]